MNQHTHVTLVLHIVLLNRLIAKFKNVNVRVPIVEHIDLEIGI